VIALAFLPSTIVILSGGGNARVRDGIDRLASESVGRIHLVLAFAVGVGIGLVFDIFVACAVIGAACGVLWTWDSRRARTTWHQTFSNWALFAGVSLGMWAGVEGFLQWAPVARRLGTPAERVKWQDGTYYEDNGRRSVFGFRSPYEDIRKPSDVYRIIALGDSFTEGSHVASPDSTWPSLLEDALNQVGNRPPAQVVNMGFGGWATGNEAELLRRLGWQWEPDLVLVQWLNNDFLVTTPDFGLAPRDQGLVQVIPERYRTGLIRDSAVLWLLERILTNWLRPARKVIQEESAPGSPGWLAVQEALREMGSEAAIRCTPILLVLYPYLYPGHWTVETHPERELHERVAVLARDLGFEVLDLLPAFGAAYKEGREWWGTPYDSHPGAQAHLLAAGTIASYISEHELLADSLTREARCRQ
jgi:hypothetical protein